MKPVTFLGDSLDAIRGFPQGARREVGFQIDRIQRGLAPDSWKPMKAVGTGVRADGSAGYRAGSNTTQEAGERWTMKKQTFGSVWDALEDTKEAAANMRVRAELMIEVRRYVEKGHLTQTAAAKKLGITQPRLNDLLRGRIEKFSVDALVNMLTRAGRHVDVHVGKAA
jgi:predicted XRE-type DNA-binding protein